MADTASNTTTPTAQDLSAELASHVAGVKADIEAGVAELGKLIPDWLAHLEKVLKTLRIPSADLPAVESEVKAVTREVVAYFVSKAGLSGAFATAIEALAAQYLEKLIVSELESLAV